MGHRVSRRLTAICLSLLFFVSSTHSFYLPGVAPRDFHTGDPLSVKVNKLSSTKTQLPYDYYYLKYCKPTKILNSAENLGEVLRGDRIENSVYTFQMRQEQSCQVVCRQKLDAESAKNFKEKIDDEYRVNMILDNLPVAVRRQRRDGSQSTTYEHGFRVGFKGNYAGSKEEKYFINNHLSFQVMYHNDPETDTARIVGFEVTPNSINHEYKEWNDKNPQVSTCNENTKNLIQGTAIPQEVDTDKEVVFTYDVSFKESDVKWASRWDTYLLMNDDQIHWFSIINSLMIVLFLSGMVAMIMMRTLYRDIANYNQLETQDEAQEETGWKLVHGDVFRPPINSGLLCVYVGTGVQILAMTLVTMIFALLGFLSPSNRGGLMTATVLLWVFMGLLAGYTSARLYKMFKGTEWKRITLKTAFMFPGILFAIFFVLNALIWEERSSGAVPFGTMFALVCLWFGISVPLVFVGSYLGYKKPAIEDPIKTNKIPRQIPEQAWYMRPAFSILIGGILPFGAVFIELFFILTSIWLNQYYYIFGFLFIVFLILIITCAEIAQSRSHSHQAKTQNFTSLGVASIFKMVLQTQLGLNKHQSYAHEQNCYSDSSHGSSMQLTRPSGYSTMPYGQSTHNHMMMGHGGQHHGGHYGGHGHGHGHGGHYGSQGPHMPHDSTNFSSNTSMVHSDGGYGSGMQQSAHMSSATGMGSPNYHGHGYGGSHPSQYSQSQKFNWALKDLEE